MRKKEMSQLAHKLDAIEHICPVCKQSMFSSQLPWLWKCNGCSFLASDLWDASTWEKKVSDLDETHRLDAIQKLRQQNAKQILEMLSNLTPLKDSTLCDIGCGYGWFLDVAKQFGLTTLGIEPEGRIAKAAAKRGLNVVEGCFPDCLSTNDKFDFITFNDVLEHIPEVDRCVAACVKHLNQGGYLSIAIPSSSGIFYQIATVLQKLGINGPFERLWQKNFHSPHVSYFNDKNLEALITSNGLTLTKKSTLQTLELNGLWSRLLMDGKQSKLSAAIIWSGIMLIAPVIDLLPKDIIFHVYRKDK